MICCLAMCYTDCFEMMERTTVKGLRLLRSGRKNEAPSADFRGSAASSATSVVRVLCCTIGASVEVRSDASRQLLSCYKEGNYFIPQ